MAVARAQAKVSGNSAGTTLSLSHGGTPTAGNVQTIILGTQGGIALAPDSSWIKAADTLSVNTGIQIYYRPVPPGASAGPYVFTNAATVLAGILDEWAGWGPGLIGVGASVIVNNATSVATTGAINLGTSPNCPALVLAAVGVGGAGGTTPTAAGGLTADTGFISNPNPSLELAIATPTSPTSFASASISWTNNHSFDSAGIILAAVPPVEQNRQIAPRRASSY